MATKDSQELEIQETEERNKNDHETLIPGLPDDIGRLCLLHVPFPFQALARSVSSKWNRTLADPQFITARKTRSLCLPYVFVFATSRGSADRKYWHVLDPRSCRWFVLPSMPCRDTDVVGSLDFACSSMPCEGEIFAYDRSGSNMYVYRSSTNQWSISAASRTPQSVVATVHVDGKIIAIGENQALEAYDPETETWASRRNIPVGLRRYHTAVVESKVYVTEGWTWPIVSSPKGGVYDPKSDTWDEMSIGMRAGWSGLSVVVDKKLFVISEYGMCPLKVYVPGVDDWRYVGGEKFPCEAMQRPFAVSGAEGKVYVASSGLNVAVGSLYEVKEWEFWVEWVIVDAPKGLNDFYPSSCHVLYA